MYCTLQYSLGFDNPKGFEIPSLSDAASVRGGRDPPSTRTLAAEGIGIMNSRRQQERHERADSPKSQARVGRQVVQRATVGQTAKSAPSRPRRYYLARITDAGSVPCSATNTRIPTLIGWDFFCAFPRCWRRLRTWPRERHPCKVAIIAPDDASLFSVFSSGRASVLHSVFLSGAGLEAVGCGSQFLCLSPPRIDKVRNTKQRTVLGRQQLQT